MKRTLSILIPAAVVFLLGAAFIAGPLPFPVFLNHFYVVPEIGRAHV